MNLRHMQKNNSKRIVLFYPHIPRAAAANIQDTLSTRWIGQGPKVDLFEKKFSKRFASGNPAIAVGAGTDALHLAYILAGIQKGDEVVSPIFTCTATNIPLLYIGAKIQFADIQEHTLNIDPSHVEKLMNKHTKAIVCVHYGGLPCDMDELQRIASKWNVPIIEDAAQALGGVYQGKPIGSISDFTAFSFQATKHITTGDGGMLALKNTGLEQKAKRLRWFGIDREASHKGVWKNDITELGYKYQMTDINASMGIAGLGEFRETSSLRKRLFALYEKRLANISGVTMLGTGYKDRTHAAWTCTVAAQRRSDLQAKLLKNNIESGQVHYRNDRYAIFGSRRTNLPHMDAMEEKYLLLPLHTHMDETDVERVCGVIQSGW